LKSFVPPIEVQANARRALEVRAMKPVSERGMLDEGIARARDLANGRSIPIDTLKRMMSFFARHEVDKQGSSWSTYGKGWQAWMGWGGDAGRRWARRMLALHDKPESSSAAPRVGGKIGKADPNANYAVQGGQPISGDLGRDRGGRFANVSNLGQGAVDPNQPQPQQPAPGAPPQGVPPQGAPPQQPQGAPPQSAPATPPQQPQPQGPQPQGAAVPNMAGAQGPFDFLENLGDGRYRDRRNGQEFEMQPRVPKGKKTKVNYDGQTADYLESSGLKPTRSALEQLMIGATEGVPQDTKQRLFHAGLVDITPYGIRVNAHGKQFLNIVRANKDVASKERMFKETLYNAEQYRKKVNYDTAQRRAKQMGAQTRNAMQEAESPKKTYVPQYLRVGRRSSTRAAFRPTAAVSAAQSSRPAQQSRQPVVNNSVRIGQSGFVSRTGQQGAIRMVEGLNDTLQKNQSAFNDDVEGNSMALSQLRALSAKAGHLAEALAAKKIGLEAWQKSKATTAAEDINAVHDAVFYSSPELGETHKAMIHKNMAATAGSDFVFSDERKFPIVTPRDVRNAVRYWESPNNQFRGIKSFDEFKERLVSIAQLRGDKFIESLPDSWKEEMASAAKMSTPTFFKFASFAKANPEQRIVVGYASSERVDGQNDIVDSEALNQALGDYMQWANLREMHQPKAIGKVLAATPVRGTIQLKDGSKLTNPLRITAQIIDNETWEKVKAGVLKGFSIGGKVLQALTEKMNGKDVRRITGLQLHEISLVDRPANPDARIVLMKRDDSMPVSEDTLLQKAAGQQDPSKILPQLQQLRNQAEMDGDLEQAERYNEVISLMLEAMGVIPQGTTRDTENVESGEEENENPMNNDMPQGNQEGMMDMDQVYAYNPSFQNTSNVAYAQMPEDLQKAGRTISKATEGQLDQMAQAVQYIMQQIQALKAANQAPAQPGMPQGMPGAPMQPDMQAVPGEEAAVQTENPRPQVQPSMAPSAPTSSMAPSPETMSMLRGIGNPVLAASQSIGDLKKDGVDIASIEKEVSDMEQLTENSAPPMEAMEGTAADAVSKAAVETHGVDVDAIAKSLTDVIVSQLAGINKQMERIETTSKEQHASIFETVNPLTEAVNNTKASIQPLVEKVDSLAPLADKFEQLAQRLEALENTPVGSSPVLRGTAVNKALGGEAAADGRPSPTDELATLHKMIDETKDPLVRTKLREQAAVLETKRALFGRY